ncbi:MAG: DUF4065 domain-containing protein [Alphaproteobacteria bacterium]|nr:DUF4065 domain-containing protein [Alphaproteobacteria bacterium]
MAWPAKGVANLLLDLADTANARIDPLAIQKLVYFSEGWHLALLGESIVQEQFEAWRRGPVVPILYHSLKYYGARPIRSRLMEYDFLSDRPVEAARPSAISSVDLVREVWQVYRRYSPGQLVALTHEFGSPWEVTWRKAQGAPDARIDKALIRDWFTAQADRSQGRNLI